MDVNIKDFEAAIAELETIVKKLEDGDLTLEQSLDLYERGVRLSRYCHGRLEEAERRIEVLGEKGDLQPAPPSLTAAADDDARKAAAGPRREGTARVTTGTTPSFADYVRERRAEVERRSPACCPRPAAALQTIHDAMRYSLMAGGKRFRPIVTLAAAEAVGRRRRRGPAPRDAGRRAPSSSSTPIR